MKTMLGLFKFGSFSGKSIYYLFGLFSFTIVLTSPSVAIVLPQVASNIGGILMQVFSYLVALRLDGLLMQYGPKLIFPCFVIFTTLYTLLKNGKLSLFMTFLLLGLFIYWIKS